MKKTISFLALTILGITGIYAQTETSTSERKNDVMISPIELIASPLLNISYERIFRENMGVGVNGMFYFGNNDRYDDSAFSQVSPFYRMYFGKKYGAGFFVEGFVPITSTKDYYYNYVYNDYSEYISSPYYEPKRRTTVGIGIGLGGKWVTRNNIVFEVSGGLARRFGSNYDNYDFYDGDNLTGKGMLGIGYRF